METLAKRIAIQFGKRCLLLLFISFGLASCKADKEAKVPYYANASFTPLWDVEPAQLKKLHKIAPFSFTNQHGKTVSDEMVKDKIYLVSFFFTTCPSICPKLANTMKLVAKNFESNVNVLFLSHSVTPDFDDVNRLQQYAKKSQISSKQWHLLTGQKEDIYNLARKSYFIEEEIGLSKTSGEFLHTENFVLVDQNGHIRGLYNGTLEAEVPRIIEDINALLN